MAQVTIPDELAQSVQSQVKAHGEDLATCTARVIKELLSIDEESVLQAELIEKTRKGFSDLDAGRVTELSRLLAAPGLAVIKPGGKPQ